MMGSHELVGVILPHYSFLSQNQRSLSAYTTTRAGLARRDNILSNLEHFVRRYNIICLQETHLSASDSTTLKGQPFLHQHTVLYGNGDGTAGVITILPHSVTSLYDVAVPAVPDELAGFVLVTNLSPLDPLSNRLPFQIINLYLPSNTTLRLQVLKFILSQLIIGHHLYVCGDFNFVESLEDGSMVGPQALSASEQVVWDEFCVLGGLIEVRQPTHTYFRFDHISGRVLSSRIDRFYVSHRPADLVVAAPTCQVASAPFSSLRLHRLRVADGTRTIFNAAPDHYPLALNFVSTLPSKRRSPNIPAWVVGSTLFKTEFERDWKRAANDGFAGARAFKSIAHRVAASVLRYRHQTSASSQIRVLSAAVALLRQLTQPVPLRGRVEALLLAHKELAPCVCPLNGLPSYGRTSDFIAEYLVAGPDASQLQSADADPRGMSHATNMIKAIKLQLPLDRKRLTHLYDYSDEECMEADRPRFGEGPISRPDDMASLISHHWGKLWSKRHGAPSRDRVSRYLSSYVSRVPVDLLPTLPCREGDGVHASTEDTWEDLVVGAIKHSNNSCAGPDGVPFVVYRTLAEFAAPFLLDILIALASGVTPPLDFNLGRLFLLPKGDTHKVLDNRPITVNNADNRLIATVVTVAISPATQALVHVSQKGFVSGRRGSDNVTGITDLFYNRLETGDELHVLQVDTKKAFDSIDHDFIMAVLSHVGFPLWLVLVVQALFANASVVPVLSAHTSTRVPIRRGVKQGCPLSPTLFVIIYDPLICEIADLDSGTYPVSPFAFADDLAVAVTSVALVVTVIVIIAAFALISGLGVNDDKSRLLSTIPLDAVQLELVRNSPWPGLRQVETLSYLGIVFGIGVTVEHVFAKPLAKLADRASLYGRVLRRLSLHLRVVAVNVFLLSLFSYHIGFYYPLSVIDQIHGIIRPILVPFNGTAFKLGHLVLGPGLGAYGLVSPLKDIWAWSVSMLANKFDLCALHGLRRDEVDVLGDVRPRSLSSMVMSDHIRACANEVLQFAVTNEGICDTAKFTHNTQEGRLHIYKRVAARAWRPRTDVLDGKRLGSLVNRMTRWGCGSSEAADALTRRWCSGDVFATPRAIAHHFSLVFNAVPTNRRVAAFGDSFTNGMVTHCYFCGCSDLRYYNDSIEHIYAGCEVIKRARARFLGSFDIIFPFDLPHSLLAHIGSDPLPKPLRRILFSAIVLFNLTVWAVRWRIFVPALHPPPLDSAVSMVCNAALTDWNNFSRRTPALTRFLVLLDTGKVAPGAHAAVGRGGRGGRKRKSRSCEEALQVIQAPPPGALLLFSDGGAKPNPGPCGAGVVASRDAEWVVSLSAGLGHGSNNLGEVFAFGMALDVALVRATREAPGLDCTYFFFSDSTLAIGVITEGHTLKALSTDPIYQLVQLARGKLRSLKRLVTVRTLWVASHIGIEGNERADQNASTGVVLSARDPSDRSVVERAIASKSFIFQPP